MNEDTRRTFIGIIIIILLTIFFMLVFCISFISAYPKIVPYVNDFSNILNDSEELKLNLLADEIEKNTTYEIAIVIINNTNGQDEIEYANRIGDENGVGKKELSNGLVILMSMETRKIVIATGRGSESIFNDAKVGRIIDESISEFKEGNYYNGFNLMLVNINNEIETPIILNNSNEDNNDGYWMFLGLIFFVIVVGLIIWNNDEEDDSNEVNERRKRIIPVVLSSSSNSNSRGGFSSGGFSGGGFSGGGAGRGF